MFSSRSGNRSARDGLIIDKMRKNSFFPLLVSIKGRETFNAPMKNKANGKKAIKVIAARS